MTENTGFAAFALYNSLKLHFTSNSYDYFKYHGKTNVTKENFATRKDKYSFYKLSRKFQLEELKHFFIANFLQGDKWVGDMLTPEGEEHYKKWLKTTQSLTYIFENDILYLLDKYSPEETIKVVSGSYPKLLVEVQQGKVAIETLIIMNDIMEFFPMWEKKIDDDIIWPNFKLKCLKYQPFIDYDKSKFKTILKEKIHEQA
jgi:hypothetical protein